MQHTTTGPPVDARAGHSSGCADRLMRTAPVIVLLCEVCVAGLAETPIAMDLNHKVRYQAERSFGPASIGMNGVQAGFLQMIDSPTEWGQGSTGYGHRMGSSVASSAIRGVLAVSLDSTLHQDPRYFRSVSTGLWRRVGHALRGTILTR